MSDRSGKDEDDLFLEAMKDVERLHHEGPSPYRKRLRPHPLPREPDPEEDQLADLAIDTPDFLEYRRPGIQIRLYDDLRRGLIDPQATLDLHGMRVVEARSALLQFLAQSSRRGHRCIRIIHGKGRGSAQDQPVLKQKTNQWLRQREEVLAFCTAPRWDGGTGAVYVILKRFWQSR